MRVTKAKYKYNALVILGLIFFLPIVGSSQQPRPLTGVSFSGTVVRDGANGLYTYTYKIVNRVENNADIYAIEIDLTRAPDETDLSQQGLSNGPRFARYGSEYTVQGVPTVPVGIYWTTGMDLRDRGNAGS